MLIALKNRIGKLTQYYADLINKNIEILNLSNEIMPKSINVVHENIRILNHIASAFERIDRLESRNIKVNNNMLKMAEDYTDLVIKNIKNQMESNIESMSSIHEDIRILNGIIAVMEGINRIKDVSANDTPVIYASIRIKFEKTIDEYTNLVNKTIGVQMKSNEVTFESMKYIHEHIRVMNNMVIFLSRILDQTQSGTVSGLEKE